MTKNICGIEAFMSALQASIICLRYPGLAAWAMRYWPFTLGSWIFLDKKLAHLNKFFFTKSSLTEHLALI